MYTAKNLDAEMFENQLNQMRNFAGEQKQLEDAVAQAKYDAYTSAIEDVRGMLHCTNYESGKARMKTMDEANRLLISLLAKEFGVDAKSIVKGESIDPRDMAKEFAKLVRAKNATPTQDTEEGTENGG